ncbi:uncharacterized protein LOC127251720 isoform X2 [Andrographis paniculata]|uniref:uncharacterized protein LOC127251720 isoform X2 n=1 Tax=Andrographis paniculata TaxID=175694 RepID=UPI0021E91EB5|nr:uncharacterized protein LOC127251720 isoform X2 [Andrographis paniculata]
MVKAKSESGCASQSKGFESGSGGTARPDLNGLVDGCYLPRSRTSEMNGYCVYTRNKRLKTKAAGRIGCSDKLQGDLRSTVKTADAACSNVGGIDSGLGDVGFSGAEGEGVMMDIEIKEEPFVATRSAVPRRFTRAMLKSRGDDLENLRDTVILEADAFTNENLALGNPETRKMEMKMSKKILIKGRPTTVRELFETGLLEGYPVFYNGGKKEFPLRGTIKDDGILCYCSSCKGAQVVPPCQFEIHACKSNRRTSQYICLENGKSLLDVIKECRKSSLRTLEETIQNFIGPLPVKGTVICQNCKGLFLPTSTERVELCDSCTVALNPKFDGECVDSRASESLVALGMPESDELYESHHQRGRRGRIKRKHSQSKACTESTGKSLRGRKKGQSKISKILPESAIMSPISTSMSYSKSSSGPTSNASTSIHDSQKNKTTSTILKELSNASSLSTTHITAPVSSQSKNSWKITKKDQRMHKLVFENGGLPDGTEVAYYSNGKKLCEGYKKGSGIICGCCSSLVSPSVFESHAGWASRRKPYMYIYTSNGVSLHEFAVSLLKERKCPLKENDDLCIICADGGKLVLCDGCPRAFHQECASLSSIPCGKWYCMYCQNMFQRERFVEWNANAVAAGRVAGIDPIQQITNRCIRIVKKPEEEEVIACVICRGKDFSKSGFGPRTVILCDQCEKEYHVGCLKKCKIADLKELPKGKWFCSESCKWIYTELQDLLDTGEEKLSDSSLDIIKEKQTKNSSAGDADIDVGWRVLNGKVTSRETRVLLSQAVAIFHCTNIFSILQV